MKKHGNHGEERADLMARIQRECDDKTLPYPPELVQHLAKRSQIVAEAQQEWDRRV